MFGPRPCLVTKLVTKLASPIACNQHASCANRVRFYYIGHSILVRSDAQALVERGMRCRVERDRGVDPQAPLKGESAHQEVESLDLRASGCDG